MSGFRIGLRLAAFAAVLLAGLAVSGRPAMATQTSSAADPQTCCTLRLEVTVPEGTPPVYVTGNLDTLGPWDADAMALTGDGPLRRAALPVPRGHALEYKFTLGTWEREALGPSGMVMANHQITVEDNTTARHTIESFKQPVAAYLDDWEGSGVRGRLIYWRDVASEHLGPDRHVSIWLPPGYDAAPETRYRVLYMHDGQNLFDPRIANTGVDWGVDESIMRLVDAGRMAPVIVVAAWSTGERGVEYSPWHGGPRYARFLIEELMPRVNAEFRTLTGARNTAVMGSSMGGLLSFYLVSRHPEVFGACGCVSTHFPLSDLIAQRYFPGVARTDTPDKVPFILRDIQNGLTLPEDTRYWFDYGTEGLDAEYEAIHDQVETWLIAQGLSAGEDYVMRRYDGANHNETAWRARLDDPMAFLFGKD